MRLVLPGQRHIFERTSAVCRRQLDPSVVTNLKHGET